MENRLKRGVMALRVRRVLGVGAAVVGMALAVVAVAHAAGGSARHAAGGGKKAGPLVAVQGVRVRKGTLTQTLPFVGGVDSTYTVRVTPGVAGTVTAVDVRLGEQVRAGQVLAHLSNPSLMLQAGIGAADARAATARLQAAEAGGNPPVIAAARAALAMAQARLAALYQPSPALVARQRAALAQARVALAVDEANLRALQSGQAASSIGLRDAEQTLASLRGQGSPQAAAVAAARLALAQMNAGTSPEAVAMSAAQAAYEAARTQAQAAGGPSLANALTTLAAAEAAYRSAVQKDEQALTTSEVAYQSALQTATDQVAAARATFTQQLSAAQHAVQQGQATVAAQEATLAGLTAPPTPAALATAQAAVAEAQARLQLAEHPYTPSVLAGLQAAASVARARAKLMDVTAGKLTVTSPAAGRLVALSPLLGVPGAQVGAGTALATLQSTTLEIVGQIPQFDLALLHPGEPAAVQVSASRHKTIAAHVVGVAPTGNAASLTFAVTVAPNGPSPLLATGESAAVQVLTRQVAGAVIVPTAALQPGASGTTVYVLARAAAACQVPAASAAGSKAGTHAATSGAVGSAKGKARRHGCPGAKGAAKGTKGAKAAGHGSAAGAKPAGAKGTAAARAGTGSTATACPAHRKSHAAAAAHKKHHSGRSPSSRSAAHCAKAGHGVAVGQAAKPLTGTVRVVTVTTGLASGSWTQVTHGLRPGEVVLLPGSSNLLAAGDRVAVTPVRVPPPHGLRLGKSGATGGTVLAPPAVKAGAGKKRHGKAKGGKAKAGKGGKGGAGKGLAGAGGKGLGGAGGGGKGLGGGIGGGAA